MDGPLRDSNELYGPWMQVTNRRRRPVVGKIAQDNGVGVDEARDGLKRQEGQYEVKVSHKVDGCTFGC
ncbi:hypothetical protein GQ457_13G012600 [Hibiscus cannabinus]